MKYLSPLALLTLVFSTTAMSQQGRDFGDLVPDGQFSITQEKTNLLDSEDLTHYIIKGTPGQEEYTYKLNSVRTPKGLLRKKKNFKLEVTRNNGKLERISSVSYNSSDDNKSGNYLAQSSSLDSEGKVTSITTCGEEYGFGWFGGTKKDAGVNCLTVNVEACEYLQEKSIDQELINDFKVCTDILGKFAEHQGKLVSLIQQDHENNIKVLGKLEGKAKSGKNALEVPAKSLKDVGNMIDGLGKAVGQCNFLEERGYLRRGKSQAQTQNQVPAAGKQ
jgi:hypothetical protein